MNQKPHPLSQTNVKTINQRCLDLFRKLACMDNVRQDFTDPILKWSTTERTPPVGLEEDPVNLTWCLLRQGAPLCHLLNKLRPNTIERTKINGIDEPISKEYFIKSKTAKENMLKFLSTCKEELYMTDDQLFILSDLYADNSNALTKAVDIAEKFMKKIYDTQRFNWDKKAAALIDTCPELYGSGTKDEAEAGGEVKERNKRLLVIDELLSTERTYVADLEKLHNFAEECKMDQIIDSETHVAIFSNLNKLLDFQRKFLIAVEGPLSTAQKSVEASYKVHLGQLFVSHEKDFAVYDTFCANHKRASEVAAMEATTLMAKANYLHPKTQLPSYLIKPVQRICKYPLLLRELIKMSPADAPDLAELREAEVTMKRVGDRVNEKQRREENAIVTAEFKERLEDWKDMKENEIGDLIFHEPQLLVTQVTPDGKSVQKELRSYLFSHVIILAKEGKGSLSINTFLKKMTSTPLVIKGYIYMRQVSSIESAGDQSTFKLNYRDGLTNGSFTMHFRTSEMANRWKKYIEKEAGVQVQAMPIIPPGGEVVVNKAERRRSRLEIAGLRAAVPVATLPSQQSVSAEMRVKIVYQNDCYMLVVLDIPSLDDLRKLALKKLQQDYDLTGRQLDLQAHKMRLKYQDGGDQVVLVDEGDLAEAIELHTNELKVFISSEF